MIASLEAVPTTALATAETVPSPPAATTVSKPCGHRLPHRGDDVLSLARLVDLKVNVPAGPAGDSRALRTSSGEAFPDLALITTKTRDVPASCFTGMSWRPSALLAISVGQFSCKFRAARSDSDDWLEIRFRGLPRLCSGDLLGGTCPGRWRGKWPAVFAGEIDPLLDDLAQFPVHLHLIFSVAARANDPGALADERTILVRPLHDLHVTRGIRHNWDSSIARQTTRSW